MNDIESAIFQFISHWYGSFEGRNIYSKNGNLYQIIEASDILESYWLDCDMDGYDRGEFLDEVFDEQYGSEKSINQLLSFPYLSFPEISDYLSKGFSIKSIIELSTVVPVESELRFIMIEYTKRMPKKIKICNYKTPVEYAEEFDLDECMDEWDPMLLDEEYKEYLCQVNEWVFCNSSKPVEGKRTGYYYCKYDNLPYFFEHLRPDLLDKKNLEIRKRLRSLYKNGKTKKLGEIATIIHPRVVSNERSYNLNSTLISAVLPIVAGEDVIDKNEEISIDDLKSVFTNGTRTDTRLHKGDYYIPSQGVLGWCPIIDEPAVPVYAGPGSCVIRLDKDVSLEYLFMYFETDEGRMAINILSTKDRSMCLPYDNIELIQIVLPKHDSQYYKDMLMELYYSNYPSFDNNLTKIQKDVLYEFDPEEDFLLVKKIQLADLGHHTNLRRMVLLDIGEVYRCIKAEAYKAAIILCGGILEAVLTDWVSEIDNVDYFGEKVFDHSRHVNLYGSERRCFHDRYGRQSNIDLYHLIDRIDGLEPPVWLNDEAQYATIIRESRNKVHASLAISAPDITKEECEKVLEYLSIVLDTRGLIV